MKRTSLAVLIAAQLCLAADVVASDHLYGVNFFGNELFSIDPATGAGTLVGPLGATVSPYGVAASGASLYTFNPNNSLIQQIDPATGIVGGGVNVGLGSLQGEGDLTFRGDGMGFLASALDQNFNPVNDLYSFDLSRGTSHLIGSTGITLDGLAFDGNTLYALGQGAGKLYTVNTLTAELTEVGNLGVDQNSPFAGLTITGQGTLLGAIDDRLYTIEKASGAATAVDPNVLDFGFSSVSGIAFSPAAPNGVPESGSTAVLLGLGLGSVMLARGGRTRARANEEIG